jgi:hypothetical protein
MRAKAIKIQHELKVIRKATQGQEALPDPDIISLEKVYVFQKELIKPSFKTPFTFSPSGR